LTSFRASSNGQAGETRAASTSSGDNRAVRDMGCELANL
jgi:hypothetical protein